MAPKKLTPKQQVEQLEQSVAALGREKESLQSELHKTKVEVTKHVDENTQLRKDLDKSKNDIAALEQDKAARVIQAANLRRDVASEQAKV